MDKETLTTLARLALDQKIKVYPVPAPLGGQLEPLLTIPASDYEQFLTACANLNDE